MAVTTPSGCTSITAQVCEPGCCGAWTVLNKPPPSLGSQRQVGTDLSRQLLIGKVDQTARYQGLAQRLFNNQVDVVTASGEHHIGNGDVDRQRTLTAAQQGLLGQQFLVH